ncbi:DUF3618 domain-containing protein [Timonella senegalensis]|uniref:DUF3618 domain-containing protein n=1 Tax=Timonella senegalensis TaxID=1465825 RepID=UPI000307BEBE|nr:DUF3618 domain-containing protein [Timonella senegalensis]
MSDPRDIHPEVQAARDELTATLDELLTRVNPKNVAQEVSSATKLAATDAATFVTGGGFPHDDEDPRRARNAKAALGVAVGGAALLVLSILTKKRK